MKKIARIALALFSLLISAAISEAQTPDGWMRVTSDNGEFSAEVPAKYDFFYDKDGFSVSAAGTTDYRLTDVHIFSGFHEKTLISFECYETGNSGAEAVVEVDQQKMKAAVIDRGAYKIKQYVNKDAEYYLVKQYFRSKNYLYVVTAASREGETAALRRFLGSVVFDPTIAAAKQDKPNFSTLARSQIKVSVKEDKSYKSYKPDPAKKDDPNVKASLPVSKPRASYVDEARTGGVQGVIAMRTTLNSNGFIPEFVIVKPLGGGLIRQSVFAALRMRFLPSEKGGAAQTVSRIIEYNFTLY